MNFSIDPKDLNLQDAAGMQLAEVVRKLADASGTTDYEDLENLPKINGVTLKGNKSSNDLHIAVSDEQVTEAVDAWLEDNVAQETGYVLDSTLTMSNAAAPADKVGEVKGALIGTEQQLDLLNCVANGNLYNAYNVVKEAYLNPANGQITSASGTGFAYSPSYIPVTAGESLCSSGRPFVIYYDENLTFLSGLQMDVTKTTVVPSGAKYARFSIAATDQFSVVVARGTTAPDIGQYRFALQGLYIDEGQIVVDASGNGDYTSFTKAVYDNVDNGLPIIVKPGTYDVEAEYIALFGQTVVDSLSDATIGINLFQFGIRIHDRTVTFMSGAHLVCDWTGRTVDGTHRFCVFRVESNAEIIGLDLDCTATFYAIHDDYGTADGSPYTNRYENCKVIGHALVGSNCIGGGCGKYSRTILQNCYFKNNVVSDDVVLSADARYHNTDVAGAEPEIYISNCYFSNNFNANYYGSQTTKMRVYANNCFASKGIIKHAESAGAVVDNVELITWNNQTE